MECQRIRCRIFLTVPQEKARKPVGSVLTLYLTRHVHEEDSEKEICLASSHTLLTTTVL